MTRTTLYAAVVTLFAAAPAHGGDASPRGEPGGASAIPAQEVREVAPFEGEAVSRQARARRAPSQRAGGEDRSAGRGAESGQPSADHDQRPTDDSLRQQQIWTAP